MIVFGEIHGTNEIPALVSTVTYELAKEGARILMALEVLDLLNGELADFLAGATNVDRFLAGEAFWNGPSARQDGRSSRAMLRLLQDVRGVSISRSDDRPPRHRQRRTFGKRAGSSIALNLRTLVANLPYDHVVVLTGRWHARRTPRFLSVGPRPMASYFRRKELFLVQISFLAGSSQHCRRRGECPVHDLPVLSDARPLTQVSLTPPSPRRGGRRRNRAGVSYSVSTGVPGCHPLVRHTRLVHTL